MKKRMATVPHIDIPVWLQTVGLTQYTGNFSKFVGVEALLYLDKRDLCEVGVVDPQHQDKLHRQILDLKEKLQREGYEIREPSTAKHHNGHDPPGFLPSNGEYVGGRNLMWLGNETLVEKMKYLLERELRLPPSDIRSHAWYHGAIPRSRAEGLLTKDGDFLIRDCTSRPGELVLTCQWSSRCLHFMVNQYTSSTKLLYQFEEEGFSSVSELITWHVGSRRPVSEASSALITTPIPRKLPLAFHDAKFKGSGVMEDSRGDDRAGGGEDYQNLQTTAPPPPSSSPYTLNLRATLSPCHMPKASHSYARQYPLSKYSSDSNLQKGAQPLTLFNGNTSNSQVSLASKPSGMPISTDSPPVAPKNSKDSSEDHYCEPRKAIYAAPSRLRCYSNTHLTSSSPIKTSVSSSSSTLATPPASSLLKPNPYLDYDVPRSHKSGRGIRCSGGGDSGDSGYPASWSGESSGCSKSSGSPDTSMHDYAEPDVIPTSGCQGVDYDEPSNADLPDYDHPPTYPRPVSTLTSSDSVNSILSSYSTISQESSMMNAGEDTGDYDYLSTSLYTQDIPGLPTASTLHPLHTYSSRLLPPANRPLDSSGVATARALILGTETLTLAITSTVLDVEMVGVRRWGRVGGRVVSGLEMLALPQGRYLRQDVLERYQCLQYLVLVTCLTCRGVEERCEMIRKWLEVAKLCHEQHNNMFSFGAVVTAITNPMIWRLSNTWSMFHTLHTSLHNQLVSKYIPNIRTLECGADFGLDSKHPTLPYIIQLVKIHHVSDSNQVINLLNNSHDETSHETDSLYVFSRHLRLTKRLREEAEKLRSNAAEIVTAAESLMVECEDVVELFQTQFHLRLLWGVRGAECEVEERCEKLDQILQLLSDKCE